MTKITPIAVGEKTRATPNLDNYPRGNNSDTSQHGASPSDGHHLDSHHSDEHNSRRFKTVVFSIAHYWFALPLPTILKVLRLEGAMAEEVARNGFLMLDGIPLSIVDARSQLIPHNSSEHHAHLPVIVAGHQTQSLSTSHLIVIQANLEQAWALRVDRIPELIDLPLQWIHPVLLTAPQGVRAIAQYMAIVPSDFSGHLANQPIFLMNLNAMF